MTLLALKLFLAPSFVVAASLVSRRFGVRVGGAVGGLPAIAGPILLVLALDHGTGFASHAATGATLGVVALVGFVLAYVAVLNRNRSWAWAIGTGWATFLLGVLVLRLVDVGSLAALVLACAACSLALVVIRRPERRPAISRPHPPLDLPLRAACAALPVVAVTAAARALGPHLTGLLAAFPVITPVLAAFTQVQQGPKEAVRLLRGMTAGFYSYALFCFVVAVTVERVGIAASFLLATVLALAVQGAVIAVGYRRERALAARAVA